MIWFLRHADGTGQAPDAPLSPEGQCAALAIVPALQSLDITRIVSSPYARARETVEPFAEAARLTIHTDPRLREREHGAVPPGGWDREAEMMFADLDAAPFGGESLADVAERGQLAVAEIIAAGDGALIVTHGLWLSVILSAYGRPLDIPSWRAMPCPALFELSDARARELELPR
ncbi:MAG: histidine phosphatase family protein [Pseudomonadota bacterium]